MDNMQGLVLDLHRAATVTCVAYRKMQLFLITPLGVWPLAPFYFCSQRLSPLAMTHLLTFLPVLLRELVLLEGKLDFQCLEEFLAQHTCIYGCNE